MQIFTLCWENLTFAMLLLHLQNSCHRF